MRCFALAIALCGLVGPAAATEWLYCNDAANATGVEMLLGQADRLFIDSYILRHEDQVWASDVAVGPGEPTAISQSFNDVDRFDVDFVDGEGALLAELRLHFASEGDLATYGGTLRIVGRGAWAVSCPGS
jgi:hypothetical protein